MSHTKKPLKSETRDEGDFRSSRLPALRPKATRLEEVRRQLQLSEQRYASLFEAAQELILIVNSDGRVLQANPAALSAAGVAALDGIWRNVYEWVIPEHRPRLRKLLQQREPGGYEDQVLEFDLRPAAGDTLPVAITVVESPNADPKADIVLIARDISRHKRVEARLPEAHNRLEQVIESADAFISFFDASGRYTLINRRFANALNREPRDVIGKRPEDFLPLDLLTSIRPRLDRALDGNQVSFEVQLKLPGLAQPRWFSGTHNSIGDSRSRGNGFVTVMLDITEQKEAHDTLVERERLDIARKLARTVAHEFRQPLTALRLISEISTMDGGDSDFLVRNGGRIASLVDRLNDLVSRLLYITSLQSKPYFQDMDILDLGAAGARDQVKSSEYNLVEWNRKRSLVRRRTG